jgi:hypothetical protein
VTAAENRRRVALLQAGDVGGSSARQQTFANSAELLHAATMFPKVGRVEGPSGVGRDPEWGYGRR